ncbi:hypothetical protein [Natrononativus amylolyticus]|uniref:hypothetical protein n=1 Tax=Natrononativus amylolyticus TaxID=2963434 RepID=UPI0020CE192D|nr:hypothetical protein [Natrononativus amylolyticus]
MALDRSERLTLALAAAFLTTLALVVAVDTLLAWLAWSVAMIAVAGGALVALNRSKPAE